MFKIYSVIFILFLTSCVGNNSVKNPNQHTKSVVSAFNKSLATEYEDLAFTSFRNWDLADYIHFKLKAKKAVKGEEVLPEDITKWKISPSEIGSLNWASGRLENIMVDSVKVNYPDKLAHTQALFDCWVERASSWINKDKMEECRMDFVLETAYLENLLMPVPEEKPEPFANNAIHHKHKGHTKTKK
jgi:hypothetical protein